MPLPTNRAARKVIPMATGFVDYFPDAIAEIAHLSWIGNEQHNPGQPLHWAKEKSNDHDDCLMRHFAERHRRDIDGVRHRTKVAWRALAALQTEIENERAMSGLQTEIETERAGVSDPATTCALSRPVSASEASQSKRESMVEAVVNTASGFFLSLIVWQTIGPLFGYDVELHTNFAITTIFTVVSVARSYLWRRYFNGLISRKTA